MWVKIQKRFERTIFPNKHRQKLHSLDLEVCEVNLAAFSQMKNLKYLALGSLGHEGEEDFLTLVDNCKSLDKLKLSFGEIELSIDVIKKLINMKKDKLKHLEIDEFLLSDIWLEQFGNFPNTQYFNNF